MRPSLTVSSSKKAYQVFKSKISVLAFALALSLPQAGHALDDPGAYLAARQAAMSNDYIAAGRYYTQALISDPQNPALLENAMAAFVGLGQLDRAASIAKVMRDSGLQSQVAHLVLAANAAKTDDWMAIFDAQEADQSISPLVDGLARSWAAIGQGKMTQALASFDEVIEAEGMRPYGLYHKALAFAVVGDFESADNILGTPTTGFGYSARSAVAHAQILSQLDRNDDALAVLSAVFGDTLDPGISALRATLEAGTAVPFDVVTGPAEGMGEIAYSVAGALNGETPDGLTLQYARVGEYLNPNNTDAILLSADLLENLQQYELANETYAKVARTHPSFHQAELGRIDALRKAGKIEAAAEVAESLAKSHAELPFVHTKLGDIMGAQDRWGDANAAYSTALNIYSDTDPSRWIVLYTRAISYFNLDQWPQAEADFRAALALRPDQPQVLNYLGYSLVERGEKLDEALQMIETAVAAEPDNGAIVDSLGWVYFQLGRYEDAVKPMERAASLEAVDPIVNDHLGDTYWAVGRFIEATFQWNRALSFDPEEELADRIRRKLEVGLDAVLVEEGADPLRATDDSN